MRTKTLLIAAAALAAGVITSQAQPVYSQNVVGYANVPTVGGSTYLLTVPFAIGVSNGANEIWPLISPGVPSLPDFSTLLIWNVSTLSYTTYYSDSSASFLWDDSTGTDLGKSPVLPVGQGFFLIPNVAPSQTYTNTFVGTVAAQNGTSITNSLTGGSTYLVASPVPYSGVITNGTATGGGPNLWSPDGVQNLPDFSSLLIWNVSTLSYTTYYSDSGSPSYWDDSNGVNLAVPPSINVGQGFFLIPNVAPTAKYNWAVGLNLQ
jgi:hypothetical protein